MAQSLLKQPVQGGALCLYLPNEVSFQHSTVAQKLCTAASDATTMALGLHDKDAGWADQEVVDITDLGEGQIMEHMPAKCSQRFKGCTDLLLTRCALRGSI
uniref:Uncharacterized protein n=1 Tax=uncultured prokaryote TaxID=198431 RepID=H5S9H4_9ZZZZ|nr:hypothetical protein HGMM_F03C06C15 [uncultured prokaryote]